MGSVVCPFLFIFTLCLIFVMLNSVVMMLFEVILLFDATMFDFVIYPKCVHNALINMYFVLIEYRNSK